MPTDTVLFYAVLVAPGFVAVMTAIRLAAVEEEFSAFTLLVWSLVASLVIDTLFIGVYQWLNTDITSFDQLTGVLFEPHFRVGYVFIILGSSAILGVVAAVAILADIPGRLRRALQTWAYVQRNPRQPWSNFVQDTRVLRIKTSDGEIYRGFVSEWSRAGRSKEVRLENVQRLNPETEEYIPFDWEMLFLEKDIDRLLMLQEDDRQSFWARLKARFMECGIVGTVLCGPCDWWRRRQESEDDEEDADTEQAESEPETTELQGYRAVSRSILD